MDYLPHLNDSDSWTPERKEIRHMELQFNIFHDWAKLRLIILLSLYSERKALGKRIVRDIFCHGSTPDLSSYCHFNLLDSVFSLSLLLLI